MTATGPTLVSVIVPTYHRPDMLRTAAASVLSQRVPEGYGLELVIAVSDKDSSDDRRAAEAIAGSDARVRVTTAPRLGAAAARNAGMAVARGDMLALLDDDCIAQPGWLDAGVRRLAAADLVQGRTQPAGPMSPRDHSIRVDELSWLWESCNLFVRRAAVDRNGGFAERYKVAGRQGQDWGEDTEWGWRLVRSGATYAFAPDALVHHVVTPRSYRQWLEYELRVRHLPLMVQRSPELRRRLYRGYFYDRRQAMLSAGVGLVGLSMMARAAGAPRLAKTLLALAAVPTFSPWRFAVYDAAVHTYHDLLRFGAMVYGSVRHRRIVL